MEYRPFGKTGLQVSVIGFGAWAIGGPVEIRGIPVGWRPVDEQEALRALDRAFELGVNLFDTADVYGLGRSEELLGRAFRHRRDRVLLASKVGNEILPDGGHRKNFDPGYIRQSLESSLERLQSEYLDYYQLHNPSLDVIREGAAFEALESLRLQGLIRFFGVSISTPEEGLEIIRRRQGHGLQVLFNVLNQKPAEQLLPAAARAGYAVLARVPLASGLLTGKMTAATRFGADDVRRNFLPPRRLSEALARVRVFQDLTAAEGSPARAALAFAVTPGAVSAAIPGARSVAQVEENVAAAGCRLAPATLNALRERLGGYNFYLRYGVPV